MVPLSAAPSSEQQISWWDRPDQTHWDWSGQWTVKTSDIHPVLWSQPWSVSAQWAGPGLCQDFQRTWTHRHLQDDTVRGNMRQKNYKRHIMRQKRLNMWQNDTTGDKWEKMRQYETCDLHLNYIQSQTHKIHVVHTSWKYWTQASFLVTLCQCQHSHWCHDIHGHQWRIMISNHELNDDTSTEVRQDREELWRKVWLPGKSWKHVSAQLSSDLHSGNKHFKSSEFVVWHQSDTKRHRGVVTSDHTEPLCSGSDVMRRIHSVYVYLWDMWDIMSLLETENDAIRETRQLGAVISKGSVAGSGAVRRLQG